jgi:anti-anti-sigma regulatory factor
MTSLHTPLYRRLSSLDWLIAVALAAWSIASLFAFPWLEDVECLRSGPTNLRAMTIIGEASISAAYTWIPIRLVLTWMGFRVRPIALLLVLFGAFIVLCGATHEMGIILFWWPKYWLSAKLKNITGTVSLAVAYVLERNKHGLTRIGDREAELTDALAREEAARREASGIAAQLREQLALIERQGRTIRGLSTPVLHVARRILLMPLIGVLDSERASQATEAILGEIQRVAVAFVVLDLTGVDIVDTSTAAHLLKMVAAMRLLGAEAVLTGIQPAVASTMVDLGVNLESVKTYRTLGEGVAACAKRVET